LVRERERKCRTQADVIGLALTGFGRLTRFTPRSAPNGMTESSIPHPAHNKARRRAPAARAIASVVAAALAFAVPSVPLPAGAQGTNLPIIRDTEIEQLLRD
jgi:hypothetical protein